MLDVLMLEALVLGKLLGATGGPLSDAGFPGDHRVVARELFEVPSILGQLACLAVNRSVAEPCHWRNVTTAPGRISSEIAGSGQPDSFDGAI